MKQFIKDQQIVFSNFLGKSVQITFGPHSFTTVLESVELARVGQMKNKPEMRIRDGKNYTPPCMLLKCSDGDLYFVIEDTKIIMTTLGITIHTQDVDVRIE